MAKRKVKKTAKEAAAPVSNKLKSLNALKTLMETELEAYITYMNILCDQKCEEIQKEYDYKLKNIPEHIRKMTISEVMALQKEGTPVFTPSEGQGLNPAMYRAKQATEKKKTLKKEKKSSATASNKLLPTTKVESGRGRTLTDTSFMTPIGRFKRGQTSSVVTPKFNTKMPLVSAARKAYAGEIVMSISGSPVQLVPENPIPSNKMTLSLGNGQIITFNEKGEIEAESVQKIDEPSKEAIKNIQEELDKILHA